MLALDGHFDWVDFGPAASVGVEKEGFCWYRHGDRPVHLLEEVVDDGG